jgi:dTDP-4-amino-4,6-dideoxygalactose transaminase
MKIPFNKPYMTGRELELISQAHDLGHLSGDGTFTRQCHAWLEQHTGCHKALLTHSCTAALEMAALLLELQPGDEIIMPSFTFVSTANAFVLRGAVPVFVDIRPDTLNIDETLIEAAITPRTRAICAVHYAGIGCDLDTIMAIADRHGLTVVEDAAQGILSTWKGRPLGSIGHLGALSFQETKNVIAGEGGALLINDPRLVERAEIIREKGTNRSRFFRGEVDKYTWVDIGSSYLPGEIIAAFLAAEFTGEERHVRRLGKINAIEREFATG